jgi:ADP-ribosylglycohydrolase
MNTIVADILFSAIIGDAAGYTLNGMKKNHIKAVFRDISGYIDPAAGLKNNMHKWKKAGLYSSISQNMLITAACTDKRNINIDEYIKAIQSVPEIPGMEFNIFRDPGEAEKNFFFQAKNHEVEMNKFNQPCSRLLPPVLSLLFIKNDKEHLNAALRYVSLFTKNSSTIACSIFLLQFIHDLIQIKGQSILITAINSAEKSKNEIINSQNIIFNSGLNPDYIVSEIKSIFELFQKLENIPAIESCEKIICSSADKKKTNLITRASVNLPETILPMAIVLSNLCSDPERIFYNAMSEGGSSSSLTSLSAAITTAFHGIKIPANLLNNLINKKKISSIINQISDEKSRTSIISEIYNNEPGLTLKENEEYRAKNKNIPTAKDKKKRKTQAEVESELSKHVVESWTKLDKAKWKKERNKENL